MSKEKGNNRDWGYASYNVDDACVKAIENGDFDFAYDRYKESIENLENNFVHSKRPVKVLN